MALGWGPRLGAGGRLADMSLGAGAALEGGAQGGGPASSRSPVLSCKGVERPRPHWWGQIPPYQPWAETWRYPPGALGKKTVWVGPSGGLG